MSAELLSTAEAAARLGLTVRAVQKMIEAGRLQAKKIGRDYVISPGALESIPRQPAGRPPKSAEAKSARQKTGKTTPTPSPSGVTTSKEALMKSKGKKKGGKR